MWGVWAIPPSTGIFADLPPRIQMYCDGTIVTYETQEAATAWADECNSCHYTKWKYEVREIK